MRSHFVDVGDELLPGEVVFFLLVVFLDDVLGEIDGEFLGWLASTHFIVCELEELQELFFVDDVVFYFIEFVEQFQCDFIFEFFVGVAIDVSIGLLKLLFVFFGPVYPQPFLSLVLGCAYSHCFFYAILIYVFYVLSYSIKMGDKP